MAECRRVVMGPSVESGSILSAPVRIFTSSTVRSSVHGMGARPRSRHFLGVAFASFSEKALTFVSNRASVKRSGSQYRWSLKFLPAPHVLALPYAVVAFFLKL